MSQKQRKNTISFVVIYSIILLVAGIFNLIACSGFTVYSFIKPAAFAQGTFINNLAFVIGFFGFYIMLIFSVIYHFLLGKGAGRFITFNVFNTPLYIVFAINVIYRLVFDPQLALLGSATPAKIATNLALALIVNLTAVTIAVNYILGVKK